MDALDKLFAEDTDGSSVTQPTAVDALGTDTQTQPEAASADALDSIFGGAATSTVGPVKTTIDTVAVDDVPEATDMQTDAPALTQQDLAVMYKDKHADLFDEDGKLIDIEKAQELGIVREAFVAGKAMVPTGDVYDVPSAATVDAGLMFNEPEIATENQKKSVRSQMTRLEIGSAERDDMETDLLSLAESENMDRDEVIEQVIIPSIDEKESPYLRKFFDLTGATGYDALMSLAGGLNATAEGFQDALENVATSMQKNMPDTYDAMTQALVGAKMEPKTFAETGGREAFNFLTFLDSVPVMGIIARPLGSATKTQKASIKAADELNTAINKQVAAKTKEAKAAAGKEVKTAKDKLNAATLKETAEIDAKLAKTRAKAEAAVDKRWNRKMNISKARGATAEDIAAKSEAAAKVASENKDIAQSLIKQFEDRTGKVISTSDKDGNLVLDYDKARIAGKETAEQVVDSQRSSIRQVLTGGADVDMTDAARLIGGGDELMQPILRPEKFDALVAVASDLKKANPETFDPNKTVIDNLFDLTVNQELLAGDELIDMLNKYNLSFEDYILTVVGSGSEAGKVLNKLSQIKRARPTNELIAMQEAATKEAQGAIRKFVMRFENIRRGGLVSQIATAARNLTSGGIRAPLEGLGNVMDTALYNLSNDGAIKGTTSLLSPANWKDSFRHMKYMFGPEYSKNTKEYVDFIMEQPELAKQADLLFNNINEIQRATGRGEGGATDATLSVLEDAVDTLNVPNRWQEYLIRRGAFLGELERLTKREYGIDLMDTINEGKIRDLLNDATSVRPEGARSFMNLVEDATNKALDVTYAKQPDIPVFRSTSQFIVRNGLTVVMPFPRFMFNSMELMGQYAAGASIPLTRKVASLVTLGKVGKGPLTAKDRQRISRNLVGMATVAAAYQMRTDEDAPADYKMLPVDDGTEMDTTTQYPMRQFLYMGEAVKRLQDGTFDNWFDAKEFSETFIGTNIRQGVGQSLIQEVADLATGVDLTDQEAAARLLARPLGNYLSTWAVPFAQIIEAQRGAGVRGTTYKDVAKDPTLDFQATFMGELSRPFKQRGFTTSPDEEAALPKREFLFQDEKKRVAPMARVLGGLSLSTADSEEGEYIKRLGFTEFELGSASRVPSIRRFENQTLRKAIPTIVEIARGQEDKYRSQYAIANASVRKEFTEEQFVANKLRPIIKQSIQKVKRSITDGKKLKATAPDYTAAMLDYRRLPKDIRKAATIEFVQKYDREPEGSDINDLKALATIGSVYRQKLR